MIKWKFEAILKVRYFEEKKYKTLFIYMRIFSFKPRWTPIHLGTGMKWAKTSFSFFMSQNFFLNIYHPRLSETNTMPTLDYLFVTTYNEIMNIDNSYTYISCWSLVEAILMHDPIRFLTMGSSSFVEHERLSQSNPPDTTVDDLVTSSRLPESGNCCPVCPGPRWIFFVLVTEEVPVVLRRRTDSTFFCICLLKWFNNWTS